MYLFISNTEVMPYNGEILKRYIGKKLVKTIANPTDEDLKEFGYMELVEAEMPEYNAETQYIETNYEVTNDIIYQTHTVKDIPVEEETESIEETV